MLDKNIQKIVNYNTESILTSIEYLLDSLNILKSFDYTKFEAVGLIYIDKNLSSVKQDIEEHIIRYQELVDKIVYKDDQFVEKLQTIVQQSKDVAEVLKEEIDS